jgi:diguanylate cyclase (GGDEF)-like protein
MYTILIVDDAKDSILLLEFDLQAAGYHVLSAENGSQALNIIATENVDLLLLDLYMPNMSGLETLEKMKSTASMADIPVIMLSASDDENEIVAALELGAVDYVTKPYIKKVLLARMNTAFRLAEKTAALELMAKKDFLTGINNRRNFYSLATKMINLNQRQQEKLVIVMCDIDHFKRVNDQHGHDAGDDILREVSKIIANSYQDRDIIGRIGGEEFAVCLPQTSIDEAIIACERLRVNIEHTPIIASNSNQKIYITMSIGLTACINSDSTLGDLLSQADNALYQAKNTGRNKIVVFTNNDILPVTANVDEQASLELSEQDDYPGINTSTGINNVLGDQNLFEQVLKMFYEDHAQDANKLKTALANNDVAAMKHIAHTLKGVSSSIGAMALYKEAKKWDEAINNNESECWSELIIPLEEKLTEVATGIKHKLAIAN